MVLEADLTRVDVASIILSGTVDSRERVYCNNIKKQLTNVLHRVRENSLISENYHFVTSGAFPWSSDVYDCLWILTQSRFMGWVTGGPDFIEPSVVKLADSVLHEEKISREDFDFLKGLGRKIETTVLYEFNFNY